MVQDNDNKSVRNMMSETLINENNLRLANEKAMDLTIRKLTYINHTIQQMFAEECERAKREEWLQSKILITIILKSRMFCEK